MEIREVPVPQPKEGEVLLKVEAVGICGSDIHAMYDERKVAIPVILGHEFVGSVAETCGDCGDLKVGDWVTGIPAAYNCGKCKYCENFSKLKNLAESARNGEEKINEILDIIESL